MEIAELPSDVGRTVSINSVGTRIARKSSPNGHVSIYDWNIISVGNKWIFHSLF